MIVIEFIVTLVTIYIPAFVGLLVFVGVSLFGLFMVDEWESTK